MKNNICLIIKISLLSLALIGCEKNQTQQKIYCMGREYHAQNTTWKFDIDKENNRFFYKIESQNSKELNIILFTFSMKISSTSEIVDVETNFSFKDSNNNQVSLNENYSYLDDAIIYINYADAKEEVITAIDNNDYYVEILGKTYLPEEIYNNKGTSN